MPPPSNQRAEIEPPPQLMEEATKGFLTGVVRFGSLSILAHLILSLPHPIHFTGTGTSNTTTNTNTTNQTPKRTPTRLTTTTLYRPLVAFSNWISPASKVYRGLTPQFKTFIQLSCMTLGGCIWAERRVAEYLDATRRVRRAERRRREWGDE